MNLKHVLKTLLGAAEAPPIPDLGRNDMCWCDSGKKYKQCHLEADSRRRASQRAEALRSPSRGMF